MTMEIQGNFVCPAGDSVMRDVYSIELFHDLDDLGSGDGMHHGKVGDQGQSVSGKVHFVPAKGDCQCMGLNGLDWIMGDLKGLAWQGHIALMLALSFSFGVVSVATEPIAIREALEDGHAAAAFWADMRRILPWRSYSAGDKLMSAVRIFAAVTLFMMMWVFAKLPSVAVTFWAEHLFSYSHKNSFRYA